MVSNPRLALHWQQQSSWVDTVDADDVPSTGPVPGDPHRSALAGAVAGVVAGWLALAVAQGLEDQARLVEYLRVAIGQASKVDVSQASVWLVIAFAAAMGMLPGAGLGWLMRRLHRVLPRVVFGAVLVPSIWIAVDAFGLLRFVPRHADLVPFVPWLLAAVAYGVCVALVGPIGPRVARPWETIELLDDEAPSLSPPDAFLLLRKKA